MGRRKPKRLTTGDEPNEEVVKVRVKVGTTCWTNRLTDVQRSDVTT
jgi:hypothetical protein